MYLLRIQYIVGYTTLKMEYGLAKKEAKKLRAVKPKLTRRTFMLVVAFTCSPPDSLLRLYIRGKQ